MLVPEGLFLSVPEGVHSKVERQLPEGVHSEKERRLPEGVPSKRERHMPEGVHSKMERRLPEGVPSKRERHFLGFKPFGYRSTITNDEEHFAHQLVASMFMEGGR